MRGKSGSTPIESLGSAVNRGRILEGGGIGPISRGGIVGDCNESDMAGIASSVRRRD